MFQQTSPKYLTIQERVASVRRSSALHIISRRCVRSRVFLLGVGRPVFESTDSKSYHHLHFTKILTVILKNIRGMFGFSGLYPRI